ncbi:MAG: hypothetical protein FWD61_06160 [Phycisphaerales bacterium]|nr:hypothetical protein [Phycisphaerales bacterium]
MVAATPSERPSPPPEAPAPIAPPISTESAEPSTFTAPDASDLPNADPSAPNPSESRAFDVFHLGAAATHRRMASRICLVLAAVVYISALTALLMAFTLNASNVGRILPPGTVGQLVAILGIAAVILAGLGTTYLLCGLRMGGENFQTVLVAAIVGAVHAVVLLEVVVMFASQASYIRPVVPGTFAISLILGIACLLCLAPMIYFSVRTLQVRR